ncbi:MAG: acyl-CoA dehydrogenase family protein [Deltaproteobacteria bacterium]|nr:MAG: acyl-CoA dehydrogenase family protein [Deltaproteobacteria bacterium]
MDYWKNYLGIYLKEEDVEMAKMFRSFVEKEIMPVRHQIDDDKDHALIKKILQGLTNVGHQKAAFPPEYGGGGVSSIVSAAVMHEELSRGDSGICTAANVTTWAWMAAFVAGNKAVLDAFAPMFCGDELKLGCFAMTEPGGSHGGGGCDIENPSLHGKKIRTIAKLDGDEWGINGQKMWTSNSSVADLYCVLCTTDPEEGDEGIALIYVPADAKGLSFGKWEQKAGMEADVNAAMYLDNVRVPKEYRAAGPGKDAELLHFNVILARVLTGASGLGNAQAAFETVLKYTGERIVADKPIRDHSIAAGMLADMAIGIETARTYYLMAAHMLDNPETYGPPTSNFMLSRTSIAKVYAAEVAVMVTNKAMELMGSYGYVRDYNIEKYWRDCKIVQLWEGGAQLGRFDVCRGYYDCNL